MVAIREVAAAQAREAKRKKKDEIKSESKPEWSEIPLEATPYEEQEREFGLLEGRLVGEANPTTEALQVMIGGKGVSGHTDLTENQSVLLTQIRVIEAAQFSPEWKEYLNLSAFPEWFEVYRLSIGRKSRGESVEMFKGQTLNGDPGAPPPRIPNRGW